MRVSLGKIVFGFVLAVSLVFICGEFFLLPLARASSMNLTATVTGSVCGNGIIEPGEECDNGSSNGSCPATCSATCKINSCGGGGITTPLSIYNLVTSNITTSSAAISWNTDRDAFCTLYYGLDTQYADGTIVGNGYYKIHSLILSGLSSSTVYYFKVSCKDNLNMSAQTGDNVFTTLSGQEIPILLEINNISVSGITDSGAMIFWGTNKTAICQSRWGKTADYAIGAASEVNFSLQHLAQLSGLEAETVYHYQITCQTAAGESAVSGDWTFQTQPGPDITPPGNVIGLRAQNGNATTTLFWRNPADPDFAGVLIRRSTSYFPSRNQGTAVYDGQGVPAGSEMSFPDTGLTNETIYYYTVFAYDTSGNYASGVGITGRPSAQVPPVEPSITPPASTTPPSYFGDLFFRDFNFNQQDQSLVVSPTDSVAAQTDYLVNVSLPELKILPGTEKIVLNLSVGGKIETYLFSYNPETRVYSTVIPAIKDPGVYYASIILLNANNESLKIVAGSLDLRPPLVEVLPSLPAVVDNIRQNPVIKEISQAAATPAGKTVAAATVALSFVSTTLTVPLLNWWFLLQLVFTQPLRLLRFRKGWGTVYNSITKRPVDLALVRLYDAKTERLLASRVTDKDGRYIFLVDPGEYYLKVAKIGFEYPSELLKHVRDDGSFPDLYYGEKIPVIGDERSAIIANIPLDQEDASISDQEILRRYSKTRLSQIFSWFGPAVALCYFLVYPSFFSLALVVVHLLMLFLFRRLAGRKHKKHWGVVYKPDGKNPVSQAITRIFSSEYGRMLEFYVTDNQGRYNFLVGNNKYYVTADKPGFGTAKTPVLDLTGKKPGELAVAQDLVLPPTGKINKPDEPLSPELPPEQPAAEIPAEKPSAEEVTEEKKAAEAVKEVPTATEQKKPETIVPPLSPESGLSQPRVQPPQSFDLGSIDEIREQMENSANKPKDDSLNG